MENLCFYITLDAVKVQQVGIRTTNLTIIKAKMQKTNELHEKIMLQLREIRHE